MKKGLLAILMLVAAHADAKLVGDLNVQVGVQVGGSEDITIPATNNVVIGAGALWNLFSLAGVHIGNVVIGPSAGVGADTLVRCVFIGPGAGHDASNCTNSIALGTNTGANWMNQEGRVAIGPRLDLAKEAGIANTAELSVGTLANGHDVEEIASPDSEGDVPWTPGAVRAGQIILEKYATNAAAGRRTATLTVNGEGRLAVSQGGLMSEVATKADMDIEAAWTIAHEDVDYGDTVLIYTDGSRQIVTNSTIRQSNRPFSLDGLVAAYGGTNCVTVGDHAFAKCHSLVVACFPAAKTISNYAFNECVALESISFPSVLAIGDYRTGSGVSNGWSENVFANCLSLQEASFPLATNVSSWAFFNCASMKKIYIPQARDIRTQAFRYCESLERVDFGSTMASVPSLGATSVFSDIPRGLLVVVPDGLEDEWAATGNWSSAVTSKGVRIVSQSGAKPAIVADVTKRLGAVSLAIEGDGSLGIYTNGVLAGTLSLTQGE